MIANTKRTIATIALICVGCAGRPIDPADSPKLQLRGRPGMTICWDEIRTEPAAIEVLHMDPVRLSVSEEWPRVPRRLVSSPTQVFRASGPVNGVADYIVTASGYLLVACNYDYQGNGSGNWTAGRWTRECFLVEGWEEATQADLGGSLVNGVNREQIVFVKHVIAGERGRLRCNKYDPPYFIICAPGEAEE